MKWRKIIPGVWGYRDSCQVYAVEGPAGMVIINAGTGRWLDQLDELPAKPAALLCTHYFRDHAAGAAAAHRAGIPVHVPEGERAIFADPQQFFRSRETYIIYENVWELFAPIEGVPVAGVLRDYEKLSLAGLEIEVVPLPGVAITQCGVKVALPGGGAGIFCGEAIHSPGRLARVAPLQYDYNGLPGVVDAYWSAQRLRSHRPAALFPSLGEPILQETDSALAALQESLRFLSAGRPEPLLWLRPPPDDGIQRITDHVWRSTAANAHTWFVVSRSGKVLAIDYGFNGRELMLIGRRDRPERKRALLHGLDGLRKHAGTDRIDTVLVSHFHDDHVCGIPVLQRLFGTQCWAPAVFADLLEHPERHCFPCNWPIPIRVDRRISLDEKVSWEEYTFHFAPMSGHTRFAALIGFEADGKRFAHTGDQYFFQKASPGWEPITSFEENPISQNHVYRNGALLDGYEQSGRWLESWRPEIVIQGHQQPFLTNEAFFQRIRDWTREYEEIHRRVMPLEDDQTHFNLDSWGGWIWPYRVWLPAAGPATVTVTVRNPFPREAVLEVRLVGPSGWAGGSAAVKAGPRAEVSCDLPITPLGPCRRQPFAAELTADGQPFGQVAEALMTVGGSEF